MIRAWMSSACLFFVSLLAVGPGVSPAAAAVSNVGLYEESEPPFDNNKTPLNEQDFLLLNESGYRIQADGSMVTPDSGRPVGRSEIHMVIEELQGRQKLKALLEMTILFNRYGYTDLPPDALAEVRRIAKSSWHLLPQAVRKDMRVYFSAFELASLNTGVRPVKTPQLWLPKEEKRVSLDPEPAPQSQSPVQAETVQTPPVTAAAPVTASAIASAAPGLLPVAIVPPAAILPAVPIAIPLPAAAVAAPAAVAVVAPAAVPVAAPAVAALPAPVVVQPAAPPQTVGFAAAVPLQQARIEPIAPAVSPSAVAAPSATVQHPEMPHAVFEQFLLGAPYGHEVKNLLMLISKHAPGEHRRSALGALVKYVPLIVLDSRRSGTQMRGLINQMHEDSKLSGSRQIVLNPGPILLSRKRLLFANEDFLIPDSPDFYKTLAAAPPAVRAAAAGVPAERVVGTNWGKAFEYSDGSMRLNYTPEQMAGTLFEQLLRLEAMQQGWNADPYRVELWSRAAQFRFYLKYHQDAGAEPLLDLELQAAYREWLQRPEDHYDFLIQTLAAPLNGTMAPALAGAAPERKALVHREQIALLQAAGTLRPEEAKTALASIGPTKAADPDDLARAGQNELDQLGKPSFVGTWWLADEARLRSEQQKQEAKK